MNIKNMKMAELADLYLALSSVESNIKKLKDQAKSEIMNRTKRSVGDTVPGNIGALKICNKKLGVNWLVDELCRKLDKSQREIVIEPSVDDKKLKALVGDEEYDKLINSVATINMSAPYLRNAGKAPESISSIMEKFSEIIESLVIKGGGSK